MEQEAQLHRGHSREVLRHGWLPRLRNLARRIAERTALMCRCPVSGCCARKPSTPRHTAKTTSPIDATMTRAMSASYESICLPDAVSSPTSLKGATTVKSQNMSPVGPGLSASPSVDVDVSDDDPSALVCMSASSTSTQSCPMDAAEVGENDPPSLYASTAPNIRTHTTSATETTTSATQPEIFVATTSAQASIPMLSTGTQHQLTTQEMGVQATTDTVSTGIMAGASVKTMGVQSTVDMCSRGSQATETTQNTGVQATKDTKTQGTQYEHVPDTLGQTASVDQADTRVEVPGQDVSLVQQILYKRTHTDEISRTNLDAVGQKVREFRMMEENYGNSPEAKEEPTDHVPVAEVSSFRYEYIALTGTHWLQPSMGVSQEEDLYMDKSISTPALAPSPIDDSQSVMEMNDFARQLSQRLTQLPDITTPDDIADSQANHEVGEFLWMLGEPGEKSLDVQVQRQPANDSVNQEEQMVVRYKYIPLTGTYWLQTSMSDPGFHMLDRDMPNREEQALFLRQHVASEGDLHRSESIVNWEEGLSIVKSLRSPALAPSPTEDSQSVIEINDFALQLSQLLTQLADITIPDDTVDSQANHKEAEFLGIVEETDKNSTDVQVQQQSDNDSADQEEQMVVRYKFIPLTGTYWLQTSMSDPGFHMLDRDMPDSEEQALFLRKHVASDGDLHRSESIVNWEEALSIHKSIRTALAPSPTEDSQSVMEINNFALQLFQRLTELPDIQTPALAPSPAVESQSVTEMNDFALQLSQRLTELRDIRTPALAPSPAVDSQSVTEMNDFALQLSQRLTELRDIRTPALAPSPAEDSQSVMEINDFALQLSQRLTELPDITSPDDIADSPANYEVGEFLWTLEETGENSADVQVQRQPANDSADQEEQMVVRYKYIPLTGTYWLQTSMSDPGFHMLDRDMPDSEEQALFLRQHVASEGDLHRSESIVNWEEALSIVKSLRSPALAPSPAEDSQSVMEISDFALQFSQRLTQLLDVSSQDGTADSQANHEVGEFLGTLEEIDVHSPECPVQHDIVLEVSKPLQLGNDSDFTYKYIPLPGTHCLQMSMSDPGLYMLDRDIPDREEQALFLRQHVASDRDLHRWDSIVNWEEALYKDKSLAPSPVEDSQSVIEINDFALQLSQRLTELRDIQTPVLAPSPAEDSQSVMGINDFARQLSQRLTQLPDITTPDDIPDSQANYEVGEVLLMLEEIGENSLDVRVQTQPADQEKQMVVRYKYIPLTGTYWLQTSMSDPGFHMLDRDMPNSEEQALFLRQHVASDRDLHRLESIVNWEEALSIFKSLRSPALAPSPTEDSQSVVEINDFAIPLSQRLTQLPDITTPEDIADSQANHEEAGFLGIVEEADINSPEVQGQQGLGNDSADQEEHRIVRNK